MRPLARVLFLTLAFSVPGALATVQAQIATPAQTAGPVADSLSAVLSDWEAFARADDPMTASDEGDKAALSQLPDVTLGADIRRKAILLGFEKRLAGLDSAALGPDERLNRDLLLRTVREGLESLRFDEARLPFTAYWSFSSFGPDLGRQTHLHSAEEAGAYLKRLKALSAYYDAQIANARRGLSTGFIQPRLVVEVALRTAEREAAVAPDQSPMLAPFDGDLGSQTGAEAAALRSEALKIIEGEIAPAQKRIAAFLKNDYLPKARPGLAARDLPDGEAYYRFQIRRHTTTDLSPDQVHEIGLAEVRRIRTEMDGVIKETGFTGSFADFLKMLRTDPKFYATSREALLERYRAVAKTIDPELPRLFGRLPRLTYGVRPIPTETEEGQTTAYYEGGAPARGEAGHVGVNLSHLDQRPLYEIPVLLLHEGVPGHHLQISLAQEAEGGPAFRRRLQFTAFVEGWALYSEQLGKEIGVYQTPYERFAQLSLEMWRACRLVADTGIHWKRWTRSEAKACFMDNTALAEHNIDTELDRYISWPGQALAYKLGELKIMALRRKAEAELGPRFDIRRFHDAVLDAGALPLDLLEVRIGAFIASEKARP